MGAITAGPPEEPGTLGTAYVPVGGAAPWRVLGMSLPSHPGCLASPLWTPRVSQGTSLILQTPSVNAFAVRIPIRENLLYLDFK